MIFTLGSCFLLNDWLSFGEGRFPLKLDLQGQGAETILDVDGQGRRGRS